MGYESNNAKLTGRQTEALAAQFLRTHGYSAAKPPGLDDGIDLLAMPEGMLTGKQARLQVKGRGRAAEPRWFQVSITGQRVARTWESEGKIEHLWREKILYCDFWMLISIPLNEYWLLPSAVVIEVALANEPVYGGRRDNQYVQPDLAPNGRIAKKQKELNLDVTDGSGNPLWQRLLPFRNNTVALNAFFNRP